MPIIATVRTISHQVESQQQIDREPKYKVGDYVEKIHNGHNCTIRGVRFNLDNDQFEYFDGNILSDGWMNEKAIQRA